jgi:hypothetical protein
MMQPWREHIGPAPAGGMAARGSANVRLPLKAVAAKILAASGVSVDDFRLGLVYDSDRTLGSISSFKFHTSGESGMRKLLVAFAVVAFGWVAVNLTTRAEDAKPKYAIKDVMRVCMKGGLCKKVAKGEASADEKKQLVEMFEALAANKPPKGDDASWKEKTAALLSAAKDCEAGKDGAGAVLSKAGSACMACHSAHKGG